MHAFKALDFPVSPETGFVVGCERRGTATFATAWRTRNGGATWDTVLVDTAAADEFLDVEFPNGPDTGYALEHRSVAYWKTVDGGESWVRHVTGISLYPMVTAFPNTSIVSLLGGVK